MRPPLLLQVTAGLLLPAALFCLAQIEHAAAQASPSVISSSTTANPLFHPFLLRLQTTVHIPILLPPNVPGQEGPLVADLGAGDSQYTVSVYRAKGGQRLDFSNQVATISGMRLSKREYPLGGKPIVLVRGLIGSYLGARKTAPYAFLQWHQQGCVYNIGMLHGTMAQMKAMADWAIQHPVSSGRITTQ